MSDRSRSNATRKHRRRWRERGRGREDTHSEESIRKGNSDARTSCLRELYASFRRLRDEERGSTRERKKNTAQRPQNRSTARGAILPHSGWQGCGGCCQQSLLAANQIFSRARPRSCCTLLANNLFSAPHAIDPLCSPAETSPCMQAWVKIPQARGRPRQTASSPDLAPPDPAVPLSVSIAAHPARSAGCTELDCTRPGGNIRAARLSLQRL